MRWLIVSALAGMLALTAVGVPAAQADPCPTGDDIFIGGCQSGPTWCEVYVHWHVAACVGLVEGQ